MQHQHIARLAAPVLPGPPSNSALLLPPSFVLFLGQFFINVDFLVSLSLSYFESPAGSPHNVAVLLPPLFSFCLSLKISLSHRPSNVKC